MLAIVSEVYYRNTCIRARSRRGAAAARREDRAGQRGRRSRVPHRRLRHAPPLLARLARGGAAHARSAASGPSSSARATSSSRMEHGPHAARHDGARVPAGVPGGRPAAARFAGRSRSTCGRANTAATSGSRCPTSAGMDAFLRDFDLFFCKLFDGVRHDSGDPFEWGEKLIAHYHKMRIDPRTQDDGVLRQPQRAARDPAVRALPAAAMQTAFGIGTNLTNDLGYEPLSIVIKMTRCNGQPVAKISDEPSKTMDYDPSYVAYLREVFEVPEVRRRRPRDRSASSPARRASGAQAAVVVARFLRVEFALWPRPATQPSPPSAAVERRSTKAPDTRAAARGHPDAARGRRARRRPPTPTCWRAPRTSRTEHPLETIAEKNWHVGHRRRSSC